MTHRKKTGKENKELRITVRFDSNEYAKICDDAKSIGVTLSKFVREKILRGFVRVPKYAKVDAEAINLLSKTGGLLKKVHNDSGGVYSEKTAAILSDIRDVIRKIGNSLEDDRETYSETERP